MPVAGVFLFTMANTAGLKPALLVGSILLFLWLASLIWTVARGGIFFGLPTWSRAAFGIFAAWVFWLTSLPPYFRDDLIIHLALPKHILHAGAWVPIPFQPSSVFPNALLPFNLVLLNAGLDRAVSFLPAFFYLGTALVLAHWVKEEFGAGWGIFAGGALLLEPLFFRLSTTAYNDPAVLFFSSAGAYYFWRHLRENLPADGYKGAVALAGASAIKYNAGLFLACILVVLFLDCLRSRIWAPRLKVASASFLAALFFCSPWWIRFAHEHPSAPAPMFHGPLQERVALCGDSFAYALASPVRLFFEGEEGNKCGYDGGLNPLLLIFGMFCAPFFFSGRDRKFLAASAGLFMVSASLLFAITARYYLPVLPVMIFLSAGWLSALAEKRVALALGGAALLLILDLRGYALAASRFEGWNRLLGRESNVEFLSKTVAGYGATMFANAHLGQKDKVYFVFFGNQVYYCDVPYYYDAFWDGITFMRLLKPYADAGEIARELGARKITHVIYNKGVMRQFLTRSDSWNVFADFSSRFGKTLYEDDNSALIELVNAPR